MITGWFISLGLSIGGWFATLFAPFSLPDWLLDPTSGLYGFLNTAGGLGNWFPWAILGSTVGFAVTVFLAMLAAKLIMWLWSLVPIAGGGGG